MTAYTDDSWLDEGTAMGMIAAMRATMALALRHDMDNCESDTPSLDHQHLASILARVEANPGAFSEGKLGWWLGWMQAAVVAHGNGDISLEDMEEINMSCAEGA